jgi:hypothetical protein
VRKGRCGVVYVEGMKQSVTSEINLFFIIFVGGGKFKQMMKVVGNGASEV